MIQQIKNWLALRAIRQNNDWESDFFSMYF